MRALATAFRRPFFNERAVRGLIIVLLCLKLFATVWATATHRQDVYDGDHHARRARSGGLHLSKMAYNPPLYYLPALSGGSDQRRFRVLRLTNIAWVALFYLAWLGVILPRVVPQKRAAAVAALLLLALPGYQKLAAMVHPDNLHTALSATAVAAWLAYRKRLEHPDGENAWMPLLTVSALIGLAAWTRPFAAATVAALSGALALSLFKGLGWSRRFFVRLAAVAAVVFVLSSSWYVLRWAETGHLGPAYRPGFQKKFAADRENFDYVHYFTSFYFTDLLEKPHRTDRPRVPDVRGPHNSFFTLMYSEVWGDHWLYFSGKGRDRKVVPKRVLFVVALPLLPLLLWGLGRTVIALIRRRQRWRRYLPPIVFVLYAVLSVALFLYWQTHGGLTPGKNSAVKFIYNAYAFPLGLALAFWRPMGRRVFDLWVAYGLILNVIAFPVALYWR